MLYWPCRAQCVAPHALPAAVHVHSLLDAAETMQRLMRTWTSRGIGTNVIKVWRAKGLQGRCCVRQTLLPVREEANVPLVHCRHFTHRSTITLVASLISRWTAVSYSGVPFYLPCTDLQLKLCHSRSHNHHTLTHPTQRQPQSALHPIRSHICFAPLIHQRGTGKGQCCALIVSCSMPHRC